MVRSLRNSWGDMHTVRLVRASACFCMHGSLRLQGSLVRMGALMCPAHCDYDDGTPSFARGCQLLQQGANCPVGIRAYSSTDEALPCVRCEAGVARNDSGNCSLLCFGVPQSVWFARTKILSVRKKCPPCSESF